jgi:hypothetical protein
MWLNNSENSWLSARQYDASMIKVPNLSDMIFQSMLDGITLFIDQHSQKKSTKQTLSAKIASIHF